MSLIRISESDDWIADYDTERGMYRVSYFEDSHFVDQYWFDAYEEKEITNKTALINYLEAIKNMGKEILGKHKYIGSKEFEIFVNKLIEHIYEGF